MEIKDKDILYMRGSSNRLHRLVTAALFAALCCVATMIHIPSATNGSYNLGDTVVLLSAWLLGSAYGTAAAGIGSALADLFSGYVYYVPGTLIIKSVMAFTGACIASCGNKKGRGAFILRIVSAVTAECIMVAGYFVYAAYILGYGTAAAFLSLPGNCFQGIFGMVISLLLYSVLNRSRIAEPLINKIERRSF